MKQFPENVQKMLQTVKFDVIDERDKVLKADSVKRVKDMIIKTTVEDELNRRTESVKKGLHLADKLAEEYSSIQPDLDGEFSEDLEKGPKRYSAKQGEKKRKALVDLENLVNALNKATEDGDYSTLDKLVK